MGGARGAILKGMTLYMQVLTKGTAKKPYMHAYIDNSTGHVHKNKYDILLYISVLTVISYRNTAYIPH